MNVPLIAGAVAGSVVIVAVVVVLIVVVVVKRKRKSFCIATGSGRRQPKLLIPSRGGKSRKHNQSYFILCRFTSR